MQNLARSLALSSRPGETGALPSAADAPTFDLEDFHSFTMSLFDLFPPMDEAELQSGKATWVRILPHFPSRPVRVPSLPLSWRIGGLCATASIFTCSPDKISEGQRGGGRDGTHAPGRTGVR